MIGNYLNIELFGQGFTEPFAIAPNAKTRIMALAKFRLKSGIYLIKENDQIVYVGMSKNCVLKACYRHFEAWPSRTTYVGLGHHYSVLILPVSSHQVEGFERALICCLHPRDNKNKFSFIGEKELEPVEDEEIPF